MSTENIFFILILSTIACSLPEKNKTLRKLFNPIDIYSKRWRWAFNPMIRTPTYTENIQWLGKENLHFPGGASAPVVALDCSFLFNADTKRHKISQLSGFLPPKSGITSPPPRSDPSSAVAVESIWGESQWMGPLSPIRKSNKQKLPFIVFMY